MRWANVCASSLCLAVLAIAVATTVQATPIDIANVGFDDDSLASNPDGYVIGAPTGWTASGVGAGYQLGGEGLAAQSGANWGFLSPGTNAAGAGLGQILVVNGSALNAASGGQITINAYQGHRTDYQGEGFTQKFQIQIWRDAVGGGLELAADSGDFGNVVPGVNSWTLRSYTYTASADDVGKSLYFRLYNPGPVQVQVEGVSGMYTIPEPSAMVLLATSLFGLVAYAWRKR